MESAEEHAAELAVAAALFAGLRNACANSFRIATVFTSRPYRHKLNRFSPQKSLDNLAYVDAKCCRS
jgi:hypothetical protein